MKKIVVLLSILFVFGFAYSCNYSYANTGTNSYDLFFPSIFQKTSPNDLLVMVFLYDDYTDHDEMTDLIFNMTDEEIETKYHNEIFGSGNIDEQTWSVNDFYKENSNGKFYFDPVLIGDNTTGIYPIRLNKTYDENNFSSDMREGFKTLMDKGYIPSGFYANYTGQAREKQVLCIFPKITVPHVGTYSLNEDVYTEVAITMYSSVLSTTTHELGHTLRMPDLYGQGDLATLMGLTTLKSTVPDLRYPGAPNNYTIPAHVDPLHKIALGWYDYEIVDENSTVKLYPTTNPLYNVVIVPTEDNNQYYIIENRKAIGFESQITEFSSPEDIDDPEEAGCSSYEGINIWRIDKLGYNTLNYDGAIRKGDYVISTLKNPVDFCCPKKYSNVSDPYNNEKENTNIKITYVKNNDDDSIDIDIRFDDKFINPNSYVVRYNANDETNNYVDSTYTYAQNINFPIDLFSRNEYEFMGWNTKQDGSGIIYNNSDMVYGLSEDEGTVINLYAQWKRNSYTIEFDANGGDGIMLDQTDVVGQYIVPECEFTNANPNLKFDGWFIENENLLFKPGSTIYVNQNIRLIAQWKQVTTYTVSFNTDGGSYVENQIVIQGEKAVEPENPIKEGYKFGGWFEDSTYQFWFYFGRRITADTTLYAKWIPNENIIKTMDIEIKLPTVGNEVTIEKYEDYYEWSTQTPQLDVKILGEANYVLDDGDGEWNYMVWTTNLEDEMTPFIGMLEYDTNYFVRISFITENGYYFDENMQITVNGKPVDKVMMLDNYFIQIGSILTIPKESELSMYKILEGENQTIDIANEKDLIIKANGELSKFVELRVDNVILNSSSYSVIEGSTVVTLKNEYLSTLSEGEHSLTFVYTDGEITTNFKVAKNEIEFNSEEDVNNANSKANENTNNITNSLPDTGDNIIIWIALLIISCFSSIIIRKLIKKINK